MDENETQPINYYKTHDKRVAALIRVQGYKGVAALDQTGSVFWTFEESEANVALARIYENEKCGLLDVLKYLKDTEDQLWRTVKGRRE